MRRFVRIDYTGRADGMVFDTTRAEDAPSGAKGPFGSMVVSLGTGQLIPGLDAFLQDAKPGHHTVLVPPEKAFGKKSPQFLKLVPQGYFGKDAAKLEIGLPIQIGNQHGIVKSMSGGRIVVDFNHPLAGREVQYDVWLHADVEDPKEKVEAALKALLGITLPLTEEGGKLAVSLPKGFPDEELLKRLHELTGVVLTSKEVDMSAHDHAHSHDAHEHR